ncbi:MAG: hypothetical protein KC776_12870 [Myxococcales bacterium]|nr:hypothetical protein [Myxococcales bacterium]MCB9578402.1 hypothetical protein [Polyangiaceae bacterium]
MDHHFPATAELIAVLTAQGWFRQGERWVAPNGTLWLTHYTLEVTDPETLLAEVGRRLTRRRRQHRSFQSSYDADCSLEDAQGLAEALSAVVARRWNAIPIAS